MSVEEREARCNAITAGISRGHVEATRREFGQVKRAFYRQRSDDLFGVLGRMLGIGLLAWPFTHNMSKGEE